MHETRLAGMCLGFWGGSEIEGHPWQGNKSEAGLGYIRPCLGRDGSLLGVFGVFGFQAQVGLKFSSHIIFPFAQEGRLCD